MIKMKVKNKIGRKTKILKTKTKRVKMDKTIGKLTKKRYENDCKK